MGHFLADALAHRSTVIVDCMRIRTVQAMATSAKSHLITLLQEYASASPGRLVGELVPAETKVNYSLKVFNLTLGMKSKVHQCNMSKWSVLGSQLLYS